MMPRIREMFKRLDEDGGGTVTLDEIANADNALKEELLEIIQSDNIVEVFEVLDVDGSGELNIQEFLDGVMLAVTSDTPMEYVRMQKQLLYLREKTGVVEKNLTRVLEEIGSQGLRVKQLASQCDKVSQMETLMNSLAGRYGIEPVQLDTSQSISATQKQVTFHCEAEQAPP